MTLLVLGAGGIIGQHIPWAAEVARLGERYNQILSEPQPGLAEAIERTLAGEVVHERRPIGEPQRRNIHYVRTRREHNLEDRVAVRKLLDSVQPSAIINLAGENRVDVVEGHPQATAAINVGLPMHLAEWCDWNGAHLIQVSTQGVFSGDHAPYGPLDTPHPRTEYGAQKYEAERRVMEFVNWTIARVTFVLGVRPLATGRVNPLETMFAESVQRQVNDRFFSPSFATDVARRLVELCDAGRGHIVHLGLPVRVSRYQIALIANPTATITPVSDRDFPGPTRPADTTWAAGCFSIQGLTEGINFARQQWESLHAVRSST